MKRKCEVGESEINEKNLKNENSIRERFRYFKQKKIIPNFNSMKNELEKIDFDLQIQNCNFLKKSNEIYRLQSGLILARNCLKRNLSKILQVVH